MDITKPYRSLSALLDKLKRSRGLVSLSELETKYRKPYTALCENIRAATSTYVSKAVLQEIRIRKEYSKEAVAIVEISIKQSGLLRQISTAAFRRRDIRKIERLSHTLDKQTAAVLEPFYYQHLGPYLTENCFADPPRTPDIYSDVNGCILHDGKWMPEEILYGEQNSAT